jgi:subtilisin family serine protease
MKNKIWKNLLFVLFSIISMLLLSGCPSSSDSDSDGDSSDDAGSGLNSYQWHLVNTGQSNFASTTGTAGEDINQATTHAAGLYGSGVIVAVVDSGLEIGHADLSGNVVANESWDFAGSDNDPTNPSTEGDHGTSVGGLIAALNNSIGGRGVAPSASLKGFNFLSSSTQSTSEQISALGGSETNPHSSDVHIFNLSYGTEETDDFLINSTIESHLQYAVTTLRSGKGAIYIKSAGNGFKSLGSSTSNCTKATTYGLTCQNVNMDPGAAIPWGINVGALNATGVRSSYSTGGSGVWISSPGGEYGYDEAKNSGLITEAYGPAMLTTDQSGCNQGYANTTDESPANAFQNNENALNANCDYTSTFNGTSSAAPVLSGSIALMLEANPALSWRDVKHILAKTARQVDASESGVTVALGNGDYQADLGWVTNAANYKFHNWYGFGAVDVDAAVALAKTYTSALGTMTSADASADELALSIPDSDKDGVTTTLSISNNLTIEAVQAKITVDHTWSGDVGVELTSPSGTKSILFNILNGFYASDDLGDPSKNPSYGMALLTNAFYGESSSGTWTLRVVDGDAGSTGTLKGWKLTVYGH